MKYKVILADPPWPYQVYDHDTGHGRSAEAHYNTMSIDDICALPVDELADDNCALFMWCVWPSMFECRGRESYPERVMNAWGFEYKTKAWSWVKLNKNSMGLFTGMGFYTRANDEPCLLAVKGSMPVSAHDVMGIIMSPIREHSRKPDEQYGKIERLYPEGPYLELFARRPRPGWHVWGNEVQSDIQIQMETP